MNLELYYWETVDLEIVCGVLFWFCAVFSNVELIMEGEGSLALPFCMLKRASFWTLLRFVK